MTGYYYAPLPTCMGWVGVLASDRGIRKLALPQASPHSAVEALGQEAMEATLAPDRLEALRQELETYFAGEGLEFQEKLDLEGAPQFFVKAWAACRSIPRGETRSYAWLAAQAGSPRAVRAAGQAMAHNPVAIIIPCHRVIGSDGGMCGYGGGLALKERLLSLERSARL